MTKPKPWPPRVKTARRYAHLLDCSQGEIIAKLVASLVAWVATESIRGSAIVAVDDDGGIMIEPIDKAQGEWIAVRFARWVVGTYGPNVSPGQLEEDICARLAEIRDARKAA